MKSRLQRSVPRQGHRDFLSRPTRRARGRLATTIDGSDDVKLLASFNGGALRQLCWLRALSFKSQEHKAQIDRQSTVHEIGSGLHGPGEFESSPSEPSSC
jgi:hypothetical protein